MRGSRLALGLLPIFLSCTSGEDSSIRRTEQAIFGGTDSPALQDATVSFLIPLGNDLADVCSGTLIAPNLVVTARHCVDQTNTQIFCTETGNASPPFFGAERSTPGNIQFLGGSTRA